MAAPLVVEPGVQRALAVDHDGLAVVGEPEEAEHVALALALEAVPRHLSRRPRRRARAHAAAPLTPPLLPRARPAPLSRHTL